MRVVPTTAKSTRAAKPVEGLGGDSDSRAVIHRTPAVARRQGGDGGAMTDHAVVIAGGGPTGLMLAGELALAGVDVVIVERRVSQDLDASRAGGLHSRTDEG